MGNGKASRAALPNQSLWYQDAIIYELHIRAFKDSDGDGMGDFRGLKQKLDYLQDLGVTALWVLPFYPSPWKDDGYDIADYTNIHRSYGTLGDFKLFLREAHRRGLRVVTELVLNHTSDQHAWFQRARQAPAGSPWRDFYVWSNTTDKYKDARIIFKDFETSNWAWDRVANAYYWHRFYSHQPDLNFENPEVQKALFQVVDFWLGLGVDGLRLDAVPYLFEQENTHCENLPQTYGFLKQLRRRVDQKFSDRMLLAEANQWPEDAVAYFGNGDACHMAFHFPLMPRMFMALRMEDRFPIVDILEQTPAIPQNTQWALFLRNHDELTLEMVTDEERDYMYRMYAHDPRARLNLGIRRRLAPLLDKDRRRIELMNGLLFSLPGTPVIYYGDEIGMGDNIYLGDRNGVRTPMQWSADRNAGFSQANPQQLYLPVIIDPDCHYEVVNVDSCQSNPHSLLWFMKRLISLRKRCPAFGRGALELLHPENRKILAFVRRYGDETVLVVANLSRFFQYAQLDLSAFKGVVPVEMFGQTRFPAVDSQPYFLSMAPHSFFWFALEPQQKTIVQTTEMAPARREPIVLVSDWENLFRGSAKASLERVFHAYLKRGPWFEAKAPSITSVKIQDAIPVRSSAGTVCFALMRVAFSGGDSETYALPCTFAAPEQSEKIYKSSPDAVLVDLVRKNKDKAGILYDATVERSFCQILVEVIGQGRNFRGVAGELVGTRTQAYSRVHGEAPLAEAGAFAVKAESGKTSIVCGGQFTLRIFRRIAAGLQPDLEMFSFLEKVSFSHIAEVGGSMQYHNRDGERLTLALLQSCVANEEDGWRHVRDILGRYYERVLVQPPEVLPPLPRQTLLELTEAELPPPVHDLVGTYLEVARLLGQRTAEFHLALASNAGDFGFSPEPFSALDQRSLYQSMRNLVDQAFQLVQANLKNFTEAEREEAQRLLQAKIKVLGRFQPL
ncbi:MAG TPA: maltose alpha-D-glucosyltransferase, partial [Terriglobia bacterium]|nr:maltose alpha-D-glucosyltransferase [Terriglobia bacterium]